MMDEFERRQWWEVKKREQYLKQKREGRWAPRVLVLDNLPPGTLVSDSRGRLYLVADKPTRWRGTHAGIRRATEADVALVREKGLVPADFVSEYDG